MPLLPGSKVHKDVHPEQHGYYETNPLTATQKDIGPPEPSMYGGFEYAPSIWHGAGHVLRAEAVEGVTLIKDLFFGLSTWNPYHVVLMRTVITVSLAHPPDIPNYLT